jgi:ubiquinone/menaquinone biosynthesis C-methylase UbiE
MLLYSVVVRQPIGGQGDPVWTKKEYKAEGRRLWTSVDRYFGRGSYGWLRPLIDPQREWTQRVYTNLLGRLINSNTRWLDAGCGHQVSSGWNVFEERQTVQRALCVVGCDATWDSVRKHRSIDKTTVCGLEHMPFRDKEFNLVTLNMVAEHLADPGAVFSELARVLAVDGRLVVHTPNCAGYYLTLMRLGKALLPRSVVLSLVRFLEYREAEDVFPTWYRANTRENLRELMQPSGLIEEHVLMVTDMPLFYFFAPLCALELLATRALVRLGFHQFTASGILAVYRRVEVGSCDLHSSRLCDPASTPNLRSQYMAKRVDA